MLIVRREKECYEAQPMLACDVCGEPLDFKTMSLMAWFQDIEEIGDVAPLYLAHKGKCDQILKATHGEDGGYHEINYGLELMLEQHAKGREEVFRQAHNTPKSKASVTQDESIPPIW